MLETVLTALISGLSVGIPSVIATVVNNNKSKTLVAYKIEQLEKKQDKHNNLIERTYRLEDKVAELDRDIQEIKSKK